MADPRDDPLLAQYYGYVVPPTLGGQIQPRGPRYETSGKGSLQNIPNPLTQGNILHEILSSFGQPSLDALRAGQRGAATPEDVARTFFETGPVGPFGMARRPEWRLSERTLDDLLSPGTAHETQARLRRMLSEIEASPQNADAIRRGYGLTLTEPPPVQRRVPVRAEPQVQAPVPTPRTVIEPTPQPLSRPVPTRRAPEPPPQNQTLSVDPVGVRPELMIYHGRPARGLQYFPAEELRRGLRDQGLNWVDEARGVLHYQPAYGDSWRMVGQLTPDQLRAYLGPDLANQLLGSPLARSPNATSQSHRLTGLRRFSLGEHFEHTYGSR